MNSDIVTTVEERLSSVKRDTSTCRGVIAGLLASIAIVDKIADELKGTSEGSLACLSRVRAECQAAVVANQKELLVQQGMIVGLEEALAVCHRVNGSAVPAPDESIPIPAEPAEQEVWP
jgi:hypothetical protein